MNCIKTSSLFFGLIFILVACNTKDVRYIKLTDYLRDVHRYELSQQINAIAVITDRGNCMNCNNSFSKFISAEIENKNLLFLVCTPGLMVDISAFQNNSPNILMDQHDKFKETELMDKSGVIFLADESIDTIVAVSAETAEEDFRFIQKKLHP